MQTISKLLALIIIITIAVVGIIYLLQYIDVPFISGA